MEDIQAEVPISSRTVRNWIQLGLMPRPERVSEGYRSGVRGMYPDSAISTARLLHATRYMTLDERGKMLNRQSRYEWRIEADGTIVLRIRAKGV